MSRESLRLESAKDLLATDEALNRLATVDRRKSDVVELPFFGGLSVKETAEVLKVSAKTNSDARLETREGLAARRIEGIIAPCNRSAGGESRSSFIPR